MRIELKLLVIVALAFLVCIGCSDKKAATPEATEQTESPEKESADLDFDKLDDLCKKDASELTSEDFDFLLDQFEVICKDSKGMSKEERQLWLKNLDQKSQEYVFLIALGVENAQKKGKLSQKQSDRYKNMEEEYSLK